MFIDDFINRTDFSADIQIPTDSPWALAGHGDTKIARPSVTAPAMRYQRFPLIAFSSPARRPASGMPEPAPARNSLSFAYLGDDARSPARIPARDGVEAPGHFAMVQEVQP